MLCKPDSSVLLRIKSLSKSFGQVQILNDITLEVEAGDVICLLGQSGSGKTTLLRCINGLTPFQRGVIEFSGRIKNSLSGEEEISYRKMSDAAFSRYRTHIGMVFQRFNLFSHLTALENVAVGPRQILGSTRADATEKARGLLNLVGLGAKADLYPKQLSGGQQQRVAIARALAMEPEIVLFDEPTSALDPELVGEVLETIQTLATRGVTMLIATHEMAFARDAGTRILFLEGGRIVEDAAPDEFFERPKQPQTKRFLARTHKIWVPKKDESGLLSQDGKL